MPALFEARNGAQTSAVIDGNGSENIGRSQDRRFGSAKGLRSDNPGQIGERDRPVDWATTPAASIRQDRAMTERAQYIPNQGRDRQPRRACSAIPSGASPSRHAARNS